MTPPIRDLLASQFDIAAALLDYHLASLTTEECLWRPAQAGLHVQRTAHGRWLADWPEHERYDLGPPSIAWTTWHILFWWSMLFDHSFGAATLTREQVPWPGDADAVRAGVGQLQSRWRATLAGLDDAALAATERTRWPMTGRPFADVAAWVNIELTKNAAEIGYGRFLYAVRALACRDTFEP
ncbi:MAG: DinB family protein [Gemmatimonadaceae bacterium]|nr:DinB family protein [Gemmatimonadaceae bacterium]